jgi:sulfoxide reductase heme-binding subunit YedZ
MTAAVVASSSPWLWYVSRGSGLVLLVLFSLVVVLGVATRTGSAPSRWQRLAVAELHRNLALFAVALLILHVVTAIADPYVSIGWLAIVVPFISHYRAAAIGLGALAVDLGGAIILTSLLRERLGYRAWRIVHWCAYLAWPLAFVHSLRAGNDLGIRWVALVEWGSAAVVGMAIVARALSVIRRDPKGEGPRPAREQPTLAGTRR